MIIITAELVSAIDGHHEVLGQAVIYNDGTGTATKGNYEVLLNRKRMRVWKQGHVDGFPRKRLNVWDLMYRGLREIVGYRNK